ncbi:hypothetical protein GN956_G14203 [Arapaima gigas]
MVSQKCYVQHQARLGVRQHPGIRPGDQPSSLVELPIDWQDKLIQEPKVQAPVNPGKSGLKEAHSPRVAIGLLKWKAAAGEVQWCGKQNSNTWKVHPERDRHDVPSPRGPLAPI